MRPEGAIAYVGCVSRLGLRPCVVRDGAFHSAGRRPFDGTLGSSLEPHVMAVISHAEGVEPVS
jgi:hypothetical protein